MAHQIRVADRLKTYSFGELSMFATLKKVKEMADGNLEKLKIQFSNLGFPVRLERSLVYVRLWSKCWLTESTYLDQSYTIMS